MSIVIDPTTLHLAEGGHGPTDGEYCAMELVSYVAGETWSDRPSCTSPVIGGFMRSLNDRLNDEKRQQLLPYLIKCDGSGKPIVVDGRLQPGPVVGTRGGAALETRRAWMCVDWLVHEYTPAMLRVAGLTEHAEALERIVAITDRETFQRERAPIDAAKKAARAKRDEAWRAADAGAAWAAWAAEAAGAAWAAGAAGAAGAAWAAGAAGAAEAAGAAWAADAGAAWAAGAAGAAGAAWAAGAAGAARAAAQRSKDEGGDYWAQRDAAFKAAKPIFDELFNTTYAELIGGLRASSMLLLERLIAVTEDADTLAA